MTDLDVTYRQNSKGVVVEYRDITGKLRMGFAIPNNSTDIKSVAILDLVEKLLALEASKNG